jgi:hypothetical protein
MLSRLVPGNQGGRPVRDLSRSWHLTQEGEDIYLDLENLKINFVVPKRSGRPDGHTVYLSDVFANIRESRPTFVPTLLNDKSFEKQVRNSTNLSMSSRQNIAKEL